MRKKFLFGLVVILGTFVVPFTGKSQVRINYRQNKQTITVGGMDSDIHGFTNRSIQLAVNALPPEGGTIELAAGTFEMMAPVFLNSNINLRGCGDSTVLKRIDGFNSEIVIDADLGEFQATVSDPGGFSVGMSIQITDQENWICDEVSMAVITGIEGNTLFFDSDLIRNYKVKDKGVISNAGSCIAVKESRNVIISDLKIDGNKDKNDLLDGCFGGGIAITRAENIWIEDVHVSNFNGEGITWQITDSVTVLNNEIEGCTNMGLHPGIGSPHTWVENNKLHHNEVGLFLCWRVTNSHFLGNELHHNRRSGISTGHKDSDAIFDGNHIYENGKNGVEFRDETPENSPHRNVFINNIVEDNGTIDGGVGFKITGHARDLLLKDNIIRNSKKGKQWAPVSIRSYSPGISMENNEISGHLLSNEIHYD